MRRSRALVGRKSRRAQGVATPKYESAPDLRRSVWTRVYAMCTVGEVVPTVMLAHRDGWVFLPKGLEDSARGFNRRYRSNMDPPQRGGRIDVVHAGIRETKHRSPIFSALQDSQSHIHGLHIQISRNSRKPATLLYSSTPSPRLAGFED